MDLVSRCCNKEEGKNATAGGRQERYSRQEHTKHTHDGGMHLCSSLVLAQMAACLPCDVNQSTESSPNSFL